MENCRVHFAVDELTIKTVFRIILSANQLSIYGAVTTIYEGFGTHQDGSRQPDVLMGQSILLGEIKAEVPLENDIPSHQNLLLQPEVKAEDSLQNENPLNHQILWQQYIERIESLSSESKVTRFCMEARFMCIVEV